MAGASLGQGPRDASTTRGERVTEAVPGEPVEVLGFDGVPDAGDPFRVVENDRTARSLANERAVAPAQRGATAAAPGARCPSRSSSRGIKEGELKELNLVLKADVAGSLEALEDEIARLPQDEVQVNVIHSGVGGINESDVMLAAASDAVILGFNVRPVGDARQAAEREGVEIRAYSVIYRASRTCATPCRPARRPSRSRRPSAPSRSARRSARRASARSRAPTSPTGVVRRGDRCRVVRDGTVIYETTIDSLRRFNEDAREVTAGYECGIVLANFQDVKEGDVLEVYETRAGRARRWRELVLRAAGDPPPLPRRGEPEGQAQGAAVGQGAAPHAPRPGRGRGRPPGRRGSAPRWRRAGLQRVAADARRVDRRVVRWLDERFPQGVRVDRRVTSFDEAEV